MTTFHLKTVALAVRCQCHVESQLKRDDCQYKAKELGVKRPEVRKFATSGAEGRLKALAARFACCGYP
jgi:hypothetical protein